MAATWQEQLEAYQVRL